MWRWTLAVTLVALTAVPALAFDDNRKGFVVGFGVGITEVDFEQDFPAGSGYKDPDKGACCCPSQDIVLGWGITDQFLATWNAHRTDRYGRGGVALS
ncbi:MAG TPA: hypothetical protein VM118_06000, partial [Acidobacteriota bacterium]|nr:hypothetical protein [Acidobacteriota bacterium]